MHYERNVFVEQFLTVKRFVHHLTYYRTLSEDYKECGFQSLFWTLTIDAHLVRATIEWCKVFGSNNNATHWKKLTVEQSEMLWQSFREGLLQATGMDEEDWQQYWKSMVDFRDKFVAHRELHFSDPVPKFDGALAAAYYYDKWVRKIISPDSLGEPSLEWLATSLNQSLTPLVDKLLRVTQESV